MRLNNLPEQRDFDISIFDQKTCVEPVKTLTALCVCNAENESIRTDERLATKTAGYSDAKVIDAEGSEFVWPDVFDISDHFRLFMIRRYVIFHRVQDQ